MNANTPFDPPFQTVKPHPKADSPSVLYVTACVLGGSGANAAEIFPRLAAKSPRISRAVVADFEEQKTFVRSDLGAEFLKIRPVTRGLALGMRAAIRIARWVTKENIDVVHIFYRQRSIPFIIFLGVLLRVLSRRTRIIVDHRSVNLTRGRKSIVKKSMNILMQFFAHHLAGNPWAVESNHPIIFKRNSIIDLGYDELPQITQADSARSGPIRLWFIGSLKPKNRKTEFLIEVFNRIERRVDAKDDIEIHVAGPARPDQVSALQSNSMVLYHGHVDRKTLYEKLAENPGIGIAFMNKEFHELAPSLKFAEYAAMRFQIIASDTIGLRTQAHRMGAQDVTFVPEDAELWAIALCSAAASWTGCAPHLENAGHWSYDGIFNRQVIPLYENLTKH